MNNALNYFTSSFDSNNRKNSKGKKAVFGSTIGLAAGIGAGLLGYGGYNTYQWIKKNYIGPTDDEWTDRIKNAGIGLDQNGDDLFSKINKNIQTSTQDLNLARRGKYPIIDADTGELRELDLYDAEIPETISRAQNNQDFYLKLRKGLYKLSDEDLRKAYKIGKPEMTADQSQIRAEDIFTNPSQFRGRSNIPQSEIDNHIQSVLSIHNTDGERMPDATSIQNPINESTLDADNFFKGGVFP